MAKDDLEIADDGPLVVVSIEELHPKQLEELRGIYEEAFPSHQRMPFNEILDSARDGSRAVSVVTSGGQAIAFSVIYQLTGVPALFLEYFAVHRRHRGRGIGATLWRHDMEAASGRGSADGFVFELEDPREDGLAAGEARIRRRRVHFYARLGAYFLPVERYQVPHVAGEGVETLRLMWANLDAAEPPQVPRYLRELVVALYEEGYGLSRDHPLVRAALDSLR